MENKGPMRKVAIHKKVSYWIAVGFDNQLRIKEMSKYQIKRLGKTGYNKAVSRFTRILSIPFCPTSTLLNQTWLPPVP